MGTNAIDLVRASNGQPPAPIGDRAQQDFLDDCADMGAARQDAYQLYREFYEGEHKVELTDRAREYLERSHVRWCENFCEPMVDMVGERLTVTGFDPTIGDQEDGPATEALAQWLARHFWRANRLDETAGVVHSIALSRGDSFGIVGYDNAARRPTFTFNAPERMKACYCDDDPDRMEYAVKTWDTDEEGPSNPDGRRIVRMNVYFPDRIESYFKLHSSDGRGGWSIWRDAPAEDGTEAPWPRPWVDAEGQPLGIPVVHFRNRAQGRPYGRSELVGVVPQNMSLNKQVLDLLMVLDNQGWPQRWATGVDATASTFKTAPGEVWVSNAKDASFGQFDTANIGPILDGIDSTLARMARRSGMPLHMLLGGDAPSGESMKTAEARLVKRVKDRAISFGNRWEDAALMAIRLAVNAGDLDLGGADLSTIALDALWENPESRDDYAEAQTAAIHQSLGVSKRTLLARLGYDPDQEEARRAEEAAEAMQTAARFFDGGGDTTEPAPPAGSGSGAPPQNAQPPA